MSRPHPGAKLSGSTRSSDADASGRHSDGTTQRATIRHGSGDVPADGLSDGIAGIVLAGAPPSSDDPFARFLRGPLLPLAQTPVICYALDWLRSGSVRQAVVCANTATPLVREYLGDGAGVRMELRYVEEPHPRGPAGCARDALELCGARTFVVIEGSLVPSLDLGALLWAHRRSGSAATTVVEVERRRPRIGGDRHRLPGGVYVFEREVLEGIPTTGFHDIKQGLLERLYAKGERMGTHEVRGVSPRIIDFASYTATSRWLVGAAAQRPDDYPGFEPVGEGMHHPSARVNPTARLIGPVLVGPDACVDADAVVVGPTTIGAGSHVGVGALVTRSVLLDDCRIAPAARVDGSLLAHGVTVEAGEHLVGAVRLEPETAVRSPRGRTPVRADVRVPDDFVLSPDLSARLVGAGRGGRR